MRDIMFLETIRFVKIVFFRSSRGDLKEVKGRKVLGTILIKFVADVGKENEE